MIDKLTKDNLFFYGDITGSWKHLGYSVGIGGKYFRSSDGEISKNFLNPNINATLNFQFNAHWSANYLFRYTPNLPSLSHFSSMVQTIDEISVQRGNPKIKPSVWHRNRLYIRYNTGDFYVSLWGSYSKTNSPIVAVWQYLSSPESDYYGQFMRQTTNGDFDDNINLELNLGYQNLFNHLSLSGTLGWDKYRIKASTTEGKLSKLYANVSANAYFGSWTILANFEILPRHWIDGDTFCRDTRYNYIGVKYRWKGLSVGVTMVNPFTKRGFYQNLWTDSDVHPSTSEFYMKDFANMVELNLAYSINFGKSLKKVERTLNNKGIDTGVNIEY